MSRNKSTPKAELAPIVDAEAVAVEVAEDEVDTKTTTETPVAEETESAYESPVANEVDVVEAEEEQTVKSTGNSVADFVLLELNQYAEDMAPGVEQVAQKGAANQLRLFRVIERVFNRVEDADFKVCMDTLINWFAQHKEGVTSEAYLYRFAAEWSATPDEFTAFTRFTNLLFMTSDTKSREVLLKDLNFTYYLELGLTDNGRQRILQYFGK